jgi:hypothetical protein
MALVKEEVFHAYMAFWQWANMAKLLNKKEGNKVIK